MKKDVQSKIISKLDYLKGVKLFADLTLEQIKIIVPKMGFEVIDEGKTFIQEGAADTILYILLDGEVEVSKTLVLPEWIRAGQKKEKSIVRLSEKHHPFFGEMAMFEEKPERSASIRAIRTCEMATLSKSSIEFIVKESPYIGMLIYRNIASELVQRLSRANKDILKLTTAFTLALEG
jgi:CRP-like cAMP-binding protein